MHVNECNVELIFSKSIGSAIVIHTKVMIWVSDEHQTSVSKTRQILYEKIMQSYKSHT